MAFYAIFLLLSLTPAFCFLLGIFFAHKFLLQEVHVLEEEPEFPPSSAREPGPSLFGDPSSLLEEWAQS